MPGIPYIVEVLWANSQTGNAPEAGEITLPASVTDGQPILTRATKPIETYTFEYYDEAATFVERVNASLRQPLMRDGKQAHDRGDLLWWIATASVTNAPNFADEPEPESTEPPPNPNGYDSNGDPL
jgi:hypothetical protein